MKQESSGFEPLYDRENFDSEYLCAQCGRPLYVKTKQPSDAVCFGPGCALRPTILISIRDVSHGAQPDLYEEIEQERGKLLKEISEWSPESLARLIHKARAELIGMFFETGGMPFVKHFLALGELSLMVNASRPTGAFDGNEQQFLGLLDRIVAWSRVVQFIESLRTQRFVLASADSGDETFLLKYSEAFNANLSAMGIFGSQPSTGELFPYSDIENATLDDSSNQTVDDMAPLFDQFWTLSLQMRHVFAVHYITSKQYDYQPDALDMSVLAGWCQQTMGQQGTFIIPAQDEKASIAQLQSHFDSEAPSDRDAEDFIAMYVDSTDLVPIIIRAPSGLLIDPRTLFFFLIYLHGTPQPDDPGAMSRGVPVLEKMRAAAGVKFEDWVRGEVHKRGFTGPDEAVTLAFEYDILAISEVDRVIILADAKYRDLAPSSFTGKNLLRQELLAEGALRDEADQQQRRLEYFRDHFDQFESYLRPERPWAEYEIRSYLVTKIIPLASRYKETGIISAHEFLDSLKQP